MMLGCWFDIALVAVVGAAEKVSDRSVVLFGFIAIPDLRAAAAPTAKSPRI
jgi:hypothetical protein